MSFLLFQGSVAIYLLSAAAYLVFFWPRRRRCAAPAEQYFWSPFLLHTVNIVARAVETGHTPITSHHETVSFLRGRWAAVTCLFAGGIR